MFRHLDPKLTRNVLNLRECWMIKEKEKEYPKHAISLTPLLKIINRKKKKEKGEQKNRSVT